MYSEQFVTSVQILSRAYLNKISYCFIELNTLQKTVPTECRIYDTSKFHKILGCKWRKKYYRKRY